MPHRFQQPEHACGHNNFINDAPIHAYARRIASRIPDLEARDRFARVSRDVMVADPRNARPLCFTELAEAPDWALRAHLLGRPVHVFEPDRDAVAPVRGAARALRETCAELAFFAEAPRKLLSARDRVIWQLAREFLDKISRMSFAAIAEKAAKFRDERLHRLDQLKDDEILFSREEIYTAPGRGWGRIRSVSELSILGLELGNCLERSSRQHKGFARRLRADTARFWALRDQCGAALLAVMVDTASGRVIEARGSRNVVVRADDPDLTALMQARGLRLKLGAVAYGSAPLPLLEALPHTSANDSQN